MMMGFCRGPCLIDIFLCVGFAEPLGKAMSVLDPLEVWGFLVGCDVDMMDRSLSTDIRCLAADTYRSY
jgi:hypothetical protein